MWKLEPWLPYNARWLEREATFSWENVWWGTEMTRSARRGTEGRHGRCRPVREPTPRRRKEPRDTQIIAPVNLCTVKCEARMWNFTADLSLILSHAEVTWGFYRHFAPFLFCLWLLGMGFFACFIGVFLTSISTGICVWSFWSSFLPKALPRRIKKKDCFDISVTN